MAGRRRHLFTPQQRVETLDAFGEAALTYTDLAGAWGALGAASARERLAAQQVKADITHNVEIAWSAIHAALTPADRLVLGSRTFEIVAVFDPDGRSRTIEFTVRELL
jgi:SPP1 family predicted phage head-tail adaptor